MLGRQSGYVRRDTGDVSSWPSFARYQMQMNRVRKRGCHNRDRRSGIFCRDSLTGGGCQNDVWFEPDQFLR